jgi:hypothetical protein
MFPDRDYLPRGEPIPPGVREYVLSPPAQHLCVVIPKELLNEDGSMRPRGLSQQQQQTASQATEERTSRLRELLRSGRPPVAEEDRRRAARRWRHEDERRRVEHQVRELARRMLEASWDQAQAPNLWVRFGDVRWASTWTRTWLALRGRDTQERDRWVAERLARMPAGALPSRPQVRMPDYPARR